MTDKAFDIARLYANKRGYPVVRRAGEKDGLEYFNLHNPSYVGKKLGKPTIISVSKTGNVTWIERLDVIMWALSEMRKLKADEHC